MSGEGVMGDRYTVPCVVKVFLGTRDVFGLKRVHGLVFKVGVNSDMFVGSSFVHGYLKFGMLEDGYTVFEEMPQPDIVLWNAMINGYAQIREVDNALLECLRKLRGDGGVHGLVMKMAVFLVLRFVMLWLICMNSIFGVHQQSSDHDDSFGPDLVTVTTMLLACSNLAVLRHGKEIHGYMITKGLGNHNSEDRAITFFEIKVSSTKSPSPGTP
nr:hypothetical protein [Tanacetum cinerariifolium]